MKKTLLSCVCVLLLVSAADRLVGQDAAGEESPAAVTPRNDPFAPSTKMQDIAQRPKDIETLSKRITDLETKQTNRQQQLDSTLQKLTQQLADLLLKQTNQQATDDQRFREQKDLIQGLASQMTAQRAATEDLGKRLTELSEGLSNIPVLSLKGSITDGEQPGAALLEIDGTLRLVREGDTISVQPSQQNKYLRRLVVKQITGDSALIEMIPSGQTIVVE